MTGKAKYDELFKRVKELEKKYAKASRKESALKESEEKWRSVLENVPIFITIADRNGTIQYVNRAGPGITVEEMIGNNIKDFEGPEYHEVSRKVIKEVFRRGKTGKYQVRRIAPDLTASWYEVHYGPVKWNGEVIAVTFVTTDISEYKWAETKLSESKEELRPLFDDAHYLILKIDHNANILSTNRTMPCFIVEKIAGNTVSGYISTESQQKISQLEKKNCFLNNLHFSPAQIKVANLVRQDKTTREIADLLGLSEKTIQDHRKNIRKKLRITNKKVNLKFYLKKRSNNIPVFD